MWSLLNFQIKNNLVFYFVIPTPGFLWIRRILLLILIKKRSEWDFKDLKYLIFHNVSIMFLFKKEEGLQKISKKIQLRKQKNRRKSRYQLCSDILLLHISIGFICSSNTCKPNNFKISHHFYATRPNNNTFAIVRKLYNNC